MGYLSLDTLVDQSDALRLRPLTRARASEILLADSDQQRPYDRATVSGHQTDSDVCVTYRALQTLRHITEQRKVAAKSIASPWMAAMIAARHPTSTAIIDGGSGRAHGML